MKPNLKFLEKVSRGEVGYTRGYSMRRGGYDGFRGGEKTYEKHLEAGYVTYSTGGSLGRPGKCDLTELGRAALESAA